MPQQSTPHSQGLDQNARKTTQRRRSVNESQPKGITHHHQCREIARRRAEKERAEAFFPLRATTTAGGFQARSGSRVAVLDERTSRHAFCLRVREEGSGLKARFSRAERAIKHCASSSSSKRDHGDGCVVADESCDGRRVEDLVKAEPVRG